MRSLHCILAAFFLASGAAHAAAQEAEPTLPGASRFVIFVGGVPIGSEQVSVTRSAQGTTIAGSSRMPPPVDTVIRRLEVQYDAQMRPLQFTLEGTVRGQVLSVYTAFAEGVATSQVSQGGKTSARTEKVSPDVVALTNQAIGSYEALAIRLSSGLQAGATIPAYLALQGEFGVRLNAVGDERIQLPGAIVAARRYQMVFLTPGKETAFELWTDRSGRFIRLMVPGQSFEVARSDIASVGARREVLPRPGDERVSIPASGFNMAATVSKPAQAPAPPGRVPAVVLVGGSGPVDRDEAVAGVPVFAQIAGALADAGFLVVRYDKRGTGQSGGRFESATIGDYADDARSVVKYLWNRKDVDRKRIAILGYGEGGWIGLLAASRESHVAALVLAATAGTSGAELNLEQQQHALDRMQIPEAEKRAKIELQKKIQQAAITGVGWEALPKDVRRQADTPWFQSFLLFDPAKVIKKVNQPILIAQGELDAEVPPRHADLVASLARARKPPAGNAVTEARLPGLNHLLVRAQTGEAEEYPALKDATVSTEATAAVVQWLQKTMPPAPGRG